MKKTIIVATTADRFIAENHNHLANWTSKSDKKFFSEKTKEIGTIIMGVKTFETIGEPLPDRRNIIMSRTKNLNDFPMAVGEEKLEFSDESPKELIERLETEGCEEVAICGGSSIYTAFMEAGLVDNIFITIEPIFFGSGIGIFNKKIDKKINLIKSIEIGDGAVLLEYKVEN